MRIAAILALATALGLTATTFPETADADDTPAAIPIAEWPLEKVSRIGREIHRYDRAAWLASDVLMAAPDKSAFSALRGWIVVPEGPALKVRFIAQGEGGVYRPGWDVLVDERGAGPMIAAPAEAPLPPEQLAMFKARQTAAANIGRLRCSRNLNTVVIDDPDSDGWLVWLLTSTDQAGVIPVGGHYRFTISPDGASVVHRDMLTNRCFNAQAPERPGPGAPAALFFTQIVSKGPVETHVFLSILNRIPIYIGAGQQIFAVEGDRISDVTSEMKN